MCSQCAVSEQWHFLSIWEKAKGRKKPSVEVGQQYDITIAVKLFKIFIPFLCCFAHFRIWLFSSCSIHVCHWSSATTLSSLHTIDQNDRVLDIGLCCIVSLWWIPTVAPEKGQLTMLPGLSSSSLLHSSFQNSSILYILRSIFQQLFSVCLQEAGWRGHCPPTIPPSVCGEGNHDVRSAWPTDKGKAQSLKEPIAIHHASSL